MFIRTKHQLGQIESSKMVGGDKWDLMTRWLNAILDWILGQKKKKDGGGKIGEIQMKSGVQWIVMYHCWFFRFGKCIIVISDIYIRKNEVKSIQELSVLSLQLFCKSKIAPQIWWAQNGLDQRKKQPKLPIAALPWALRLTSQWSPVVVLHWFLSRDLYVMPRLPSAPVSSWPASGLSAQCSPPPSRQPSTAHPGTSSLGPPSV